VVGGQPEAGGIGGNQLALSKSRGLWTSTPALVCQRLTVRSFRRVSNAFFSISISMSIFEIDMRPPETCADRVAGCKRLHTQARGRPLGAKRNDGARRSGCYHEMTTCEAANPSPRSDLVAHAAWIKGARRDTSLKRSVSGGNSVNGWATSSSPTRRRQCRQGPCAGIAREVHGRPNIERPRWGWRKLRGVGPEVARASERGHGDRSAGIRTCHELTDDRADHRHDLAQAGRQGVALHVRDGGLLPSSLDRTQSHSP
jgi:hypothetical protein